MAIERTGTNFRIATIPLDVERAFSKRCEAIGSAAAVHGYRTPKGMDPAALRTRYANRTVGRDALYAEWRTEARALGFDLNRVNIRGAEVQSIQRLAGIERPFQSLKASQLSGEIGAVVNKLAASAATFNQQAEMPGVGIRLTQREQEHDRG